MKRRYVPLALALIGLCAASRLGAEMDSAPAVDTSAAASPETDKRQAVLKELKLLDGIPEADLDEKSDPAFAILRKLYDKDGPEFSTLRVLMGQAETRSQLNPTVRGVAAGLLADRWDSATLSGNLWLAALRSKNTKVRTRAQDQLPGVIQPPHIPVLISLLSDPAAGPSAHDVLQRVTGQTLPADSKAWKNWWKSAGATFDLAGESLTAARSFVKSHAMPPLDDAKLWYAPDSGVDAWRLEASSETRKFALAWIEARRVLDRITHQPDPRITQFLEELAMDPDYGNWASVVLAHRNAPSSAAVVKSAYEQQPSVGRAYAMGLLGDASALRLLLNQVGKHSQPLSYRLLGDDIRAAIPLLSAGGHLPAEEAFESLVESPFGLNTARVSSEKKQALKRASRWLDRNERALRFDPARRVFTSQPASR